MTPSKESPNLIACTPEEHARIHAGELSPLCPSKESLQAARALIPHIESGTIRRYASRLADDGPIVTLMAEAIDTAYAEHRERKDELQRDVNHAVSEAKRRVPDYPWDQNTASEAVWALGESLLGVSAACDDWRKRCERLELVAKAVLAFDGRYHEFTHDMTGLVGERPSCLSGWNELAKQALAALKEHHDTVA
jgi:hypothetical protein